MFPSPFEVDRFISGSIMKAVLDIDTLFPSPLEVDRFISELDMDNVPNHSRFRLLSRYIGLYLYNNNF